MIPVDREEKRRLILRAALAVFARRGYDRATVSDIAAQADIGKGVVYDYFASKEELFAALFEFVFPQDAPALKAAVAAARDPIEELLNLAGALLEHYRSLGDYFNVVAQFWARGQAEGGGGQFEGSWAQLYSFCRREVLDCVRRGIASGLFRPELDAEAAAWAIISTLDGGVLQWLHDRGRQPLVENGLAALRLLLRGMLTGAALERCAAGEMGFFSAPTMTDRPVIASDSGTRP